MLSSLTCSTLVQRNVNVAAHIAPATTSMDTAPRIRLCGLPRSLQVIVARATRASAPLTYSTQRATAYAADSISLIPLRPGTRPRPAPRHGTPRRECDAAPTAAMAIPSTAACAVYWTTPTTLATRNWPRDGTDGGI